MFLVEKGIEIPTVQVDLLKYEQQTEQFGCKNSLQKLPVLELEDGTCIAESVSICRYLEGLYPERPLFGTDNRESALIDMWIRRLELEVCLFGNWAFLLTHPYFEERWRNQSKWAEQCQREYMNKLDWLDSELANRPFIAGDNFSMADIVALTDIEANQEGAIHGDLGLGDHQKNLIRWYEAMMSRQCTNL